MGSDSGSASFRNAVDRTYDDLDELFSAGEDVRSIRSHPGWIHVARLLEAEVESIDAALDGRLLQQDEYAFKHGRRGGLRAFQAAADAIVSRADMRLAEQRRKHEGVTETPEGAMA